MYSCCNTGNRNTRHKRNTEHLHIYKNPGKSSYQAICVKQYKVLFAMLRVFIKIIVHIQIKWHKVKNINAYKQDKRRNPTVKSMNEHTLHNINYMAVI